MADMMSAWAADGKGGIDFIDVPAPNPAPGEALIECWSTMVSRGEIRHLPHMPAGHVLGLDLAGVVVRPAADGSGPPAGARVIAMTGHSGGGWGQLAALPATTLGVIPDDLSWASAGVLPNQGLTAFYCVRHAGLLLGKRVLVTGVTGGVARIAAQLARMGGAEVVGTVSRPGRVADVAALDLAHVAVGIELDGPFDLIVDTIGGGVLTRALEVVGPNGIVVTMGGGDGFDAPTEPAVIPNGWFFQHPAARLQAENVGFHVLRRHGVAANLETLARLVADGKLVLDVEQEADWRNAEMLVNDVKAGKRSRRVALLIR